MVADGVDADCSSDDEDGEVVGARETHSILASDDLRMDTDDGASSAVDSGWHAGGSGTDAESAAKFISVSIAKGVASSWTRELRLRKSSHTRQRERLAFQRLTMEADAADAAGAQSPRLPWAGPEVRTDVASRRHTFPPRPFEMKLHF